MTNPRGNHKTYAIDIDKEGNVTIADCLIIHLGGLVRTEAGKDNGPPRHSLLNCHFLGSRPKWWQVGAWWRILRDVHQHLAPPEGSDT